MIVHLPADGTGGALKMAAAASMSLDGAPQIEPMTSIASVRPSPVSSDDVRSRITAARASDAKVEAKAGASLAQAVEGVRVTLDGRGATEDDATYAHLAIWTVPALDLQARDKAWHQAGQAIGAASDAMKTVYGQLKSGLPPALAKLDFGFSVTDNGSLVATGVSGAAKDQLTARLNQSDDLKRLATAYAQGIMDFVHADSAAGFGRYKLDFSTFQDTIDIGKAIDEQLAGRVIDGKLHAWMYQLTSRGTIDQTKVDALTPVRLS